MWQYSVGKIKDPLEFSYIDGENVKLYNSYFETVVWQFLKLNN